MEVKLIKSVDEQLVASLQKMFASKSWSLEKLNEFVEDNFLFLAFENNLPVGFLKAYKLIRMDEKPVDFFIYEIEVHKDYQKRGIGKNLINYCLKIAKDEGCEEVFVLTSKSNAAAVALYKSTGGKIENGDDVMFVFNL